ncbi:Uncharacterised protein [uncultured archaeon]|nr:Uncharacterised protein [uncultured archaeon]
MGCAEAANSDPSNQGCCGSTALILFGGFACLILAARA